MSERVLDFFGARELLDEEDLTEAILSRGMGVLEVLRWALEEVVALEESNEGLENDVEELQSENEALKDEVALLEDDEEGMSGDWDEDEGEQEDRFEDTFLEDKQ